MTMPEFEISNDFILKPSIIAAFTESKIKFRCFKFEVTHFGCDDDHPALYYALIRPRPDMDRWLYGAEVVGGSDGEFTEAVRERAVDRPPSKDFKKLATVFGRPWSLVVRNPVPVIMHQERAVELMPTAWKILFRDRTLVEIDAAVIDAAVVEADVDEDAEWDEWPVLEILKDRYGDGVEL